MNAQEFGKTKIFIPAQSDLPVLGEEELIAKRAAIKEKGQSNMELRTANKALEAGEACAAEQAFCVLGFGCPGAAEQSRCWRPVRHVLQSRHPMI